MTIMCYQGERRPDMNGAAGQAWAWTNDTATCLGAWLIHRADAHPWWHNYMLSVVHLRDVEGAKPAHKISEDATHELQLFALDPDQEPDPDNQSSIHRLTPPNLVFQLRRFDDAAALKLAEDMARQFTVDLNPDTDHRGCQMEWLREWMETRNTVQ